MSDLIEISGIYTNPAGVPMPGVHIMISSHRNSEATLIGTDAFIVTGARGEYSFLLAPGGYTVTATRPDKRPEVLGRIHIEEGGPAGSLNTYLRYGDDFYSDGVVFNEVKRHSDDAMIAAALARSAQYKVEQDRLNAEKAANESSSNAQAAQSGADSSKENAETAARESDQARREREEAAQAREKAEEAAESAGGAAKAEIDNLKKPDGLKYIGGCASVAALRLQEPETDLQKIDVIGYHTGSSVGGGEFVFDATDTITPDDGGMCIVTAGGARWKRNFDDLNHVYVTHFGASPGGLEDCAEAVAAMFDWSAKTNPSIGVKFPAGKFFISKFDISSKYISFFRVTGAPVEFGYFPTTTIVSDRKDGFIFHVKARFVELANLYFDGEYDKEENKKGFFKNICIEGQFFRGKCLRWNNIGGNALSLIDTLDTKIDQFYSNKSYDDLILITWSNGPNGNWDHSTAVELTNFNIQYAYVNAFNIQRATQSIINNGWIEHSENPGDLSNGHWLIKALSIESSTNPLDLTYARIVNLNMSLQDGGKITTTTLGKEEWLSAFERGYTEIEPHGVRTTGSINYGFVTSEARIVNNKSSSQWFELGFFSIPNDGDTVSIKLIGSLGFDATAVDYRVRSTRHGNGEGLIRLQRIQGRTVAAWEGSGSNPLLDVRFTSVSGAVTVYISLGPWVSVASPLVETTSKDRYYAGSCFYWRPRGIAMTEEEVNAVEGIKQALPQAAWGAGGKGIVIAGDGYIAFDTVPVVENKLRMVINGSLYDIALTPVVAPQLLNDVAEDGGESN